MAMAAVVGTTVVKASDTTAMDSGVMMDTMRTKRVNTEDLRRAMDVALDGTMVADREAVFKDLPTTSSRGWPAQQTGITGELTVLFEVGEEGVGVRLHRGHLRRLWQRPQWHKPSLLLRCRRPYLPFPRWL